MIPKASNRLDLLFPVGISLVLSTAALLIFPGVATVACEFLIGLLLIGFFVLRTAVRYLRERDSRIVELASAAPRSLERNDLLLLLGFAAVYAGLSGVLVRAGWPLGVVRSCAFLLLIAAVLVKPRVAASYRWRRQRLAAPDIAPPPIPLTITSGDQDRLAAEIGTVEALLATAPKNDALGWLSLTGRRNELLEQLTGVTNHSAVPSKRSAIPPDNPASKERIQ